MSFRLLAFWDRDLRGLFGVSFLTGRDGPAPRALRAAGTKRRMAGEGFLVSRGAPALPGAGKKSEARHCGTARPGRKRRTEKAACRGPRQQSQRAVGQAHTGSTRSPLRVNRESGVSCDKLRQKRKAQRLPAKQSQVVVEIAEDGPERLDLDSVGAGAVRQSSQTVACGGVGFGGDIEAAHRPGQDERAEMGSGEGGDCRHARQRLSQGKHGFDAFAGGDHCGRRVRSKPT